MVEEAHIGVHQGNAQLITGTDDHLISSGAGGGCNVLDTTLKTQKNRTLCKYNNIHNKEKRPLTVMHEHITAHSLNSVNFISI